MKQGFSFVTRKGQITIPVEFRRELGIREGDRIGLVLEEDVVKLARTDGIVEKTRGAMKSRRPSLTSRALRAAAEQGFVEETRKRSDRR